MSFSLSPIGNEQQVTQNGAPLSGGLLYTYLAGSSTPAATYTDSSGATPQSNPIVLNVLGRPDNPIWLTDGTAYKFVLDSSVGVTQWTIDNITGVAVFTPSQSEWETLSTTPTYINATQFSVPGDQTTALHLGRRVRLPCTGGVRYGVISASAFTTLTTVTVVLDSGSLDAGLSAVSVGILSASNSSIPWIKSSSTGLTVEGQFGLTDSTKWVNLPVASDVVEGISERATTAEAQGGTDGTRFIVAATMKAAQIQAKTVQVTTSGTAVNFTDIPSWVKKITVALSGVSLSGSSHVQVQLGDPGGLETTGYLSSGGLYTSSAGFAINSTSGVPIYCGAAANVVHGSVVFTLQDSATNTWVAHGSYGLSNTAAAGCCGGSKALSATLDRLSLVSLNGLDTFDAGSVNVIFE